MGVYVLPRDLPRSVSSLSKPWGQQFIYFGERRRKSLWCYNTSAVWMCIKSASWPNFQPPWRHIIWAHATVPLCWWRFSATKERQQRQRAAAGTATGLLLTVVNYSISLSLVTRLTSNDFIAIIIYPALLGKGRRPVEREEVLLYSTTTPSAVSTTIIPWKRRFSA